MAGSKASAADYQLALDALRDGVILWSADGRVVVANAAVSQLLGLPPGLVAPGVRRVEIMTYLARRGDYGKTDDPDRLAAELSDRFGTGAVTSLTRRLPDGRYICADAHPTHDGRLVVTYQQVHPDGHDDRGGSAAV